MSEPRTWNLSPKMWMSSNSASVSDLLEELSTLTDLERELVSKLHSLREDRSKLTLRLMTLVDQNPMLVSTPQQKVWACPKGKARILTLPNLDALAQFFFEAGAAVSPGQKREVASYLRRNFPDISETVLERVLQANRSHLAGSHLMLESWLHAGRPDKMSWTPVGSSKQESIIRMTYPFEDFNMGWRRSLEKAKSPPRNDLELSHPMILELQYLHARKEWIKAHHPMPEFPGLRGRSPFQSNPFHSKTSTPKPRRALSSTCLGSSNRRAGLRRRSNEEGDSSYLNGVNFVHLSSVGRGKQQQQQQHPTEYLSSTENKSRKPDLKTMKSSKNQFVTLNEAKKLNPKEQDGAELPDGKNCCGVNFNKGGGHNHSAGNLYASLLEDIKSPEGEEFCPTCELPRDVDMCGVSDAETGA